MDYNDLLTGLINKTKRNEAIWKETSLKGRFLLKFDDGGIYIDPPLSDEDDYSITFIGNEGEKIGSSIFFSSNTQLGDKIKELYSFVEMKFGKDSQTLNYFLDELKSNKIIGKS